MYAACEWVIDTCTTRVSRITLVGLSNHLNTYQCMAGVCEEIILISHLYTATSTTTTTAVSVSRLNSEIVERFDRLVTEEKGV